MEENEKKESNLSKCSSCGYIEMRVQVGMYPDGRNKK